jgi:hypothetical protein
MSYSIDRNLDIFTENVSDNHMHCKCSRLISSMAYRSICIILLDGLNAFLFRKILQGD